jgi:hypothetical protein
MQNRILFVLGFFISTFTLFFIQITQVQAATINVNTTLDSYDISDTATCSLRGAITAVNTQLPFGGCIAGTGNDTIILPAGDYVLTRSGRNETANVTGDLNITNGTSSNYKTISIQGADKNTTRIIGNEDTTDILSRDRVMRVGNYVNLTISNLTIRDGMLVATNDLTYVGGWNLYGAGIWKGNYGNFTLDNAIVTANRFISQRNTNFHGGGISIGSFGIVNIDNSEFIDNTIGGDQDTIDSAGQAGALGIFDAYGINISNSEFKDNNVSGYRIDASALHLSISTDNNVQNTKTVNINNSVIEDNHLIGKSNWGDVQVFVGAVGIYNYSFSTIGNINIANTSISNNTIYAPSTQSSLTNFGSGLSTWGHLNISDSIIDSNSMVAETDNYVEIWSGGLLVNHSLTMNRTSVTNNSIKVTTQTNDFDIIVGAGIMTFWSNFTTEINNSTISGNLIEYNVVNNSGDSISYIGGAGLFLGGLENNLSFNTIANNTAPVVLEDMWLGAPRTYGSGIYGAHGDITLKANIIENSGTDQNNCYMSNHDNGGYALPDSTINSLNYNIDSDGSCFEDDQKANDTIQSANILPLNTNTSFITLPILTHYIDQNSSALDYIPEADCTLINGNINNLDNRSSKRKVDGNIDGTYNCDTGAFELNLALFKVDISPDRTEAKPGDNINYDIEVTTNGHGSSFKIEMPLPDGLEYISHSVSSDRSGVIIDNSTMYITHPGTYYDNMLRKIDMSDLSQISEVEMILSDDPSIYITGAHGLSIDPTTGLFWANFFYYDNDLSIYKNFVGIVDKDSGEITRISPDLNRRFASMAFDIEGNLYGSTGPGGAGPNSLYLVNKSDGSISKIMDLPASTSGSALAYNWDDGYMYYAHSYLRHVVVIDLDTLEIIPDRSFDLTPNPDEQPIASFVYAGNGEFIADSWCDTLSFDLDGNVSELYDYIICMKGTAMDFEIFDIEDYCSFANQTLTCEVPGNAVQRNFRIQLATMLSANISPNLELISNNINITQNDSQYFDIIIRENDDEDIEIIIETNDNSSNNNPNPNSNSPLLSNTGSNQLFLIIISIVSIGTIISMKYKLKKAE